MERKRKREMGNGGRLSPQFDSRLLKDRSRETAGGKEHGGLNSSFWVGATTEEDAGWGR